MHFDPLQGFGGQCLCVHGSYLFWEASMPVLASPRHEAFAHALARGSSATAAYIEVGYKQNRHNAAALARKQHISTRVGELHEEQLAIHQQATAEAAANAQVTIESLIAEAEAARAKAMEEKGGAAAAVSALIAKAKLAGMWREKVDLIGRGWIRICIGAVKAPPSSHYQISIKMGN
jgi:hypothetical protein